MFAELAHKKENMQFCVALHKKLRIRLHPSKELIQPKQVALFLMPQGVLLRVLTVVIHLLEINEVIE